MTLLSEATTKEVVPGLTMSDQSQYQKRRELETIYNGLERGQKRMLFEMLLEDWAETLPQKGKDQGVIGGNGKWTKRLKWLQDHWGTQFPTKGTLALRKMPMSGVIELLALYTLSIADVKDDLEFGSFEMQTDLSNKVNTALSSLRDSSGEQIVIPRSAYNELQRVYREFAEEGGDVREDVSRKILGSLGELLKSLPSVKNEKEQEAYEKSHAAYEASKARKEKKEEILAGFSK